MDNRSRPYERILSLDGGGTWALIQARALQDLFGNEASGYDVLRSFDLVAANSGGSIVAAALAVNKKLSEIVALFEEEAARRAIFRAKLPRDIGTKLPIPRYPTRGKYEGLREHLGERAMTKLAGWSVDPTTASLAHLLIIGFDYDVERATFFRTDTKSLAASGSNVAAAPADATLLDAVHASTNAPVIYFDAPTTIPPTPGGHRRFWDGAIGGYNNPALAGVIEALANGATRAAVRVLSLGTGTVRRPRRPAGIPVDDHRFEGGQPPGLVRDFMKLASSIVGDPPDAASFIAHVTLGGALPKGERPVTDGPVVRMSPTVRPELHGRVWSWPSALEGETSRRLVDLDMDAVEASEVALIRTLCDAWLVDGVPNQPIRAGESLTAEVGHDTYGAAKAEVRKWLRPRAVGVSASPAESLGEV